MITAPTPSLSTGVMLASMVVAAASRDVRGQDEGRAGHARESAVVEQLATPAASLLLAADGPDAQRFVVVGGGAERDPAVIWRTTDGGRTFAAAKLPPITRRLYDVRFVDGRLGFACGLGATLLRTRNGGATWESVMVPCKDAWLASVAFVDEKLGIVVGAHAGPLLLWTEDGGDTWTRGEIPGPLAKDTNNVRDVLMLDRRHGIACGDGGLLLRTVDGCRSWQRLESGSTAWLRHLAFVDHEHGFLVAGDGQVLATDDGGATWTARGKVPGKANSVLFRTPHEGYVVTMDGLLCSTADGGRTFREEHRHRFELCDLVALGEKTLCVGGNGFAGWLTR
ncbi:MAG: hypothetical protein KDC98_07570 [Planctomycetes bacterium]|nr:hypothetical protein [Planctomycetota bacterium]